MGRRPRVSKRFLAKHLCGGDLRLDPDLQAELVLTPFSIQEVLESVAVRHFPEITELPTVQFAATRRLAYINNPQLTEPERRYIVLSSAFNSPDTDRVIIETVLKHELLHIKIPGRTVEGGFSSHPPEFFEAEREISPELDTVWRWIWREFTPGLKRDLRSQSTYLTPMSLRGLIGNRRRRAFDVFADS